MALPGSLQLSHGLGLCRNLNSNKDRVLEISSSVLCSLFRVPFCIFLIFLTTLCFVEGKGEMQVTVRQPSFAAHETGLQGSSTPPSYKQVNT